MPQLDQKKKIIVVAVVLIGIGMIIWASSSKKSGQDNAPIVQSIQTNTAQTNGLQPSPQAVPEAVNSIQAPTTGQAPAVNAAQKNSAADGSLINQAAASSDQEQAAAQSSQEQDYQPPVAMDAPPEALPSAVTSQGTSAVSGGPKSTPGRSPFGSGQPFQKFIVYQDKPTNNHYVMSGFMPDGQCVQMNDVWLQNCHEGRSCIQAQYDTECSRHSSGWAGVYWLDPANNWGDEKGGYNLTGAKKLVFWARGEKGGEIISSFKVGGSGVNRDYPDTDSASIGPITLTKDWQEYSIDLAGKDLKRIIGGFAWVANAKDNAQPITFYLDDIHYE